MTKTKKALLLVADAKVGKFYVVENYHIKDLILETHVGDVCPSHDKSQEGGASHTLKSYAPHSDPKAVERQCLSRNLVKELHKLLDKAKYDQLILVCGPKIMGDIRRTMPAHIVNNMDIKEVLKDVAHETVHQLQEHVIDKLKFGHSE